MKNVLSVGFFFLAFSLFAQGKYATKTGTITFEASVPSFEEVKAINTSVSAVLNTETKNFAALALIKGFRFKVALMEEHFNENYIESSKYPKATFKGTISNFNFSEIASEAVPAGRQEKEYLFSGTLNLHGVDKEIDVPAIIKMEGETISITLQFILKPEDFNIKIPSIVSSKIAEEVAVSASFQLNK